MSTNANEKLKARIEELKAKRHAPTSAREALDLAWNLAHPVKEGQTMPDGTQHLWRDPDGRLSVWVTDKHIISRKEAHQIRTLDPVPEPEPDWLDAPAVLAATIFEDRAERRTVFVRESKTGTQWVRDTKVYRWDELIDVVPLYPKEMK